MNLTEKLLALDSTKIRESKKRTEEYICQYLSVLMGQEIKVKLTQIEDDIYKELMAQMVPDENDSRGETFTNSQDVFADMATYSIEEKELFKNEELMKKFKAEDPKDLVVKLFPGTELSKLGEKMVDLCEYEYSPEEKEAKKN